MAAWGRDSSRHGHIFQHTRASFSFLHTRFYLFFFFFPNDQLGLGCGLWCAYVWSVLHFILLCFILKCLHIFLSHYWLCTSSQSWLSYDAITNKPWNPAGLIKQIFTFLSCHNERIGWFPQWLFIEGLGTQVWCYGISQKEFCLLQFHIKGAYNQFRDEENRYNMNSLIHAD